MGQLSLSGEWKPIKVTVYNAFSNATSVLYDINNLRGVKENLLKQYLSKWQIDSNNLENGSAAFNSGLDKEFSRLDTVNFKTKLNTDFIKFDSARLVFKEDSTLYINSYGLIIPTAVPGWHFGDKVRGKWAQNQNELKFTIGDNKINYPFFYKIIKHSSDSLILGMTTESYEEMYMTLEFTR